MTPIDRVPRSPWLSSALALSLGVVPHVHAADPQRIVSTAPSVTETLFALGIGARVVGVTTFCRYPEEARSRSKIGGYSNPSLEAILALKPDLVVVGDTGTVTNRLAELGIPTLEVRPESFRSIDDSIRAIARRVGVPERGEARRAGGHRRPQRGGQVHADTHPLGPARRFRR